ncbi:hypothetical protein [Allohahella sp. A8]|uniref:hypothetical protein n=1 Tax=Allohahella sp. A8 TaxID=3141461 RepID=UPI003A80E1BC
MSKESKARIKAAEAAFFTSRRRLGATNTANLRSIVQEISMGALKEDVSAKYGYKTNHPHHFLNNVWRQPEFQEWVRAVQDDMQEVVQAQYIKEHHKRDILSEVQKKEELTELFYALKGQEKYRDALAMVQELNKMEGHYAPTKTEVKDTTDTLDDAELDAAIAAELAQLKHVAH